MSAIERVLPRLALDFTTASLDPRITFTRTTGASNPATYINSSGIITAATNNQPRFDYDPATLVCKGLLIEESRTNSLLDTDSLSTQIVTVTAAIRTLSFYGTGSVTLSGAHAAVVSGTGAYPARTTYSFTPSAGSLTLTVAGTVQFAQLEAGAFATSYIPTTTTSLTRNADLAVMTGTNFSDWFNASEGTFSVEFIARASASGPTGIFSANNSSSAYAIDNRVQSNAVYGRVADASVNQCFINMGSVTTGQSVKSVLAYKADDFIAARNGATPVSDTSGTVPTLPNRLLIGGLDNNAFPLNSHIKRFAFYPQHVLSAEVQAFSKG
jgi:hypothetical protein